MVEVVRISFWLLAAYGAAGLVFAIAFLRGGAAAMDPGSRHSGWGFRLVIVPGIVALWPLLALRWRRTATGRTFLGDSEAPVKPRRLRATHRLAWKALAVLIPLVLAAALWWRPRGAGGGPIPAALSASPWATKSEVAAPPTGLPAQNRPRTN